MEISSHVVDGSQLLFVGPCRSAISNVQIQTPSTRHIFMCQFYSHENEPTKMEKDEKDWGRKEKILFLPNQSDDNTTTCYSHND